MIPERRKKYNNLLLSLPAYSKNEVMVEIILLQAELIKELEEDVERLETRDNFLSEYTQKQINEIREIIGDGEE